MGWQSAKDEDILMIFLGVLSAIMLHIIQSTLPG